MSIRRQNTRLINVSKGDTLERLFSMTTSVFRQIALDTKSCKVIEAGMSRAFHSYQRFFLHFILQSQMLPGPSPARCAKMFMLMSRHKYYAKIRMNMRCMSVITALYTHLKLSVIFRIIRKPFCAVYV